MLRYDHYKLLGIGRDATLAQVKRAYRERVKSCHPDVNPSPRATLVFRAVHEAYTVLSDTARRMRYDAELQYYREAPAQAHSQQNDLRKYGRRRPHNTEPVEEPAGPVDRFAFFGLHLTGLLFGLLLVSGILLGILFNGWPLYTALLSLFGLAVLPDSLSGLRAFVSGHEE
jgi:hypothetical protein